VAQRALVGFALSPGIADELRGAGLDDRAVIALPNAVDISVFGGASRTVLRRGAVRLGFVGKLGPTKDPLILVDAVRILRSQGIDAAAVFVGPFVDASFGRVFKRGVAERGLEEHVTLVGFADDVHERMRHDMDVFVLASHAEGLPGALVEAMAGGLPSVVTDVGSMALHVRASQSGRVVAHSAEAVALAASELSMSPEQWSRASLAASQYAAENFSSARVAEIYMSAVTHRLQEI
jgi:glycosyltransferase involved in cell wall biosynthesis